MCLYPREAFDLHNLQDVHDQLVLREEIRFNVDLNGRVRESYQSRSYFLALGSQNVIIRPLPRHHMQ